MTRIIAKCLAAMLLLVASGASAQEAIAPSCDATQAQDMDFAGAMTAPLGSCVVLQGVRIGHIFAADGAARYMPELRENDPSSTDRILGLVGDVADLPPQRARIIGWLADCAAIRPNVGASVGYCDVFKGRVLHIALSVDLGDAALTRLTRAMAGAEAGDLSPLADGDVARQMAAAAAQFLGLLRSGDRAGLTHMLGGGADGRRDDAGVGQSLHLMLDDAASPFASVRRADGTAVVSQVFGWKAPIWADAAWHAARTRTGTAEGLACFSTAQNAAALWPIDSRDADNVPGRPYACARILLLGTGADAPVIVEAIAAPTGFPEP